MAPTWLYPKTNGSLQSIASSFIAVFLWLHRMLTNRHFWGEWPSELRPWYQLRRCQVQILPGIQSGLGTTMPNLVTRLSVTFRSKTDKCNNWHWMKEAVPSRMAEGWPWGSQLADKKIDLFHNSNTFMF